MLKSRLSLAALALGAAFALAAPLQAATVIKTYGTAQGAAGDPTAGSGTRVVKHADYIEITDSGSLATNEPFFQSFDLSSITNTITGISFTIDYSHARNQSYLGFIPERWTVYVADRLHLGAPDVRSSSTAHAFSDRLLASGPTTYVLSGAALSTAIAGNLASIWFGENSASPGSFRLKSITMTVSAVPVPAAGLLLLGALGGLAALKRRKQTA